MSILDTNSRLMLEKSVDFLWTKQKAHLDNVSNTETPYYKVKTVTFEEEFARRLAGVHDHGHDHELIKDCPFGNWDARGPESYRQIIEGSEWEVHEDGENTRMDDNGVNVIEQMTEMVRTAYQLQYTYQAISKDFSILSAAING